MREPKAKPLKFRRGDRRQPDQSPLIYASPASQGKAPVSYIGLLPVAQSFTAKPGAELILSMVAGDTENIGKLD